MNKEYGKQVTIEECREAYARDEITMPEYEMVIMHAVEKLRPPPKPVKIKKIKPALTDYEHQIRRSMFNWFKFCAAIETLISLVSVTSQVAKHHPIVSGLILTDLISSSIIFGVSIAAYGAIVITACDEYPKSRRHNR